MKKLLIIFIFIFAFGSLGGVFLAGMNMYNRSVAPDSPSTAQEPATRETR
ncbi:hypothetical protein [Morganella psychrotolerans]